MCPAIGVSHAMMAQTAINQFIRPDDKLANIAITSPATFRAHVGPIPRPSRKRHRAAVIVKMMEIEMPMLYNSRMYTHIEIRSAEGGDDSKLFVQDLAAAYRRLAAKFG